MLSWSLKRRGMREPGKLFQPDTHGARREKAVEGSTKINTALEAFGAAQYERASALLQEALAERESAELWNDWATAELACQRPETAERGYRRSLERKSVV